MRAHAARFLGDIEPSINGDRERAGALFDEALSAARELGDPWTLARTLLVAGWAPYWRGDIDTARAMFEEALAVTRANAEGDAWAESRAFAMLAVLESEDGDEEQSLVLAAQGLATAESAAIASRSPSRTRAWAPRFGGSRGSTRPRRTWTRRSSRSRSSARAGSSRASSPRAARAPVRRGTRARGP